MTVSEGGWGWVVVFCSFYHHLFMASAVYSLSVYYGSWVEDFNTGRGLASWVPTLIMAGSMGSGPLAASLSSRFGNREVVIAGSIISAVGFFISCFVTSIYVLIVLSLASGVGLGMQYLPTLALIPFYFNKKRSVATGIAVSGCGVGTFLYPPFLIWLEELYSWRGAMIIISGFNLNMAVCGALLRPVESREADGEELDEEREGQKDMESEVLQITQCIDRDASSDIDSNSLKLPVNTTHSTEYQQRKRLYGSGLENGNLASFPILQVTESKENQRANDAANRSPKRHFHTHADMCSVKKQGDKNVNSNTSLSNSINIIPSARLRPETTLLHRKLNDNPEQNLSTYSSQRKGISGSLCHLVTFKSTDNFLKHQFSSANELHNGVCRNKNAAHYVNSAHCLIPKSGIGSHSSVRHSHVDILLASSVFDLVKADRRRNNSIMYLHESESYDIKHVLSLNLKGAAHLLQQHVPRDDTYTERGSRHDVTYPQSTALTSATDPSKPQFYCSVPPTHLTGYLTILRNPYFATFAVCNFLSCLTYLMPVVYLVDRAVDNGVEKSQAALAFSMYGAGNLFGRIAVGLLADCAQDSLILGAICLMGCGVSTCLSPLSGAQVVLHGLYGLTFGFCIGGFVTLTPLILVDLLGLAMVSRSLGLILVFQALGFIAGTPVAGWIFDAIGSYTISFLLHGAVIGVSGLVLLALKVVLLRTQRRDTNAAVDATVSPVIVNDEDKNPSDVDEEEDDDICAKLNKIDQSDNNNRDI
ncbi:monocarboxylate transporter 12 [Plakobranchus ocellatus]|uniref:Monocarboxylate transporter 12 n=1 Tax=Plakobranchus ocellatus TaxID=259542 RepID=A0AAV4CFX3_9GAST|nr:monocarboxylate transporter 12 [Plakobranchus ocellatus]